MVFSGLKLKPRETTQHTLVLTVDNKGLYVSPVILLDVNYVQTNGEIRLRHSEITSWIPFRYTVWKGKTVGFFLCPNSRR